MPMHRELLTEAHEPYILYPGAVCVCVCMYEFVYVYVYIYISGYD